MLGPIEARGQDERREVGVGFAQLLDQLGAFSIRYAEVYNPEVSLNTVHFPTRLGERPRLGDHLEPGLLIEDESERLTKRSVVLYKQDSLHLSPSRTFLVTPCIETIYQLWRLRRPILSGVGEFPGLPASKDG